MSDTSDGVWERYSRQILFGPLGREGQKRLGTAAVAVVGCGALGSVQAEMLVRAGVGRMTLIDRDYLDYSNLQRQSLYDELDVREGVPKAAAAARRLGRINSAVEIRGAVVDLSSGNALELLAGHDLLLDGTDNFETRFLINEAAISLRIPWIYGACVASYALTATFLPGRAPCLRCLVEDLQLGRPAETCDTAGIIGPAVHWTASVQIAEAFKILTGQPELLHGSLMTWDAWDCQFQRIVLKSSNFAGCSVCRDHQFPYLNGEKGTAAAHLCGRDAVMLRPQREMTVPLDELKNRLSVLVDVTCNEYLLKAHIEGVELVVFADGRGVVRGTDDPAVARSIYARYVGT